MAYCLMPNHFHILIAVRQNYSSSEEEISKPIQDSIAIILRSYTRAINKKFDRTGSLFQMGTKAKNTEDYAFECFHYIHQNPFRSKLVDSLDKWEFSSFLDYSDARNGTLCNKAVAYELLDISPDPDKFKEQSYAVIPDSFTGWFEANK